MSRTIKEKVMIKTRLASNYGSWVYCEKCEQSIGYLCYATYDDLSFDYVCKCGSKGSVRISFDEERQQAVPSSVDMTVIKNRLCCPADQSPLITIRDVNLESYSCEINCIACSQRYFKKKY